MALLNVNPTRVNLRDLEKRKTIAERGHTLLKEKQDALIRRYLVLIDETKSQRRQVDEYLFQMQQGYQLASLENDDQVLEKVLNAQQYQLEVASKLHMIFGVKVPRYQIQEEARKDSFEASAYLPLSSLSVIETLKKDFQRALVQLAELEKACALLCSELVMTRRRVNSLEFKTIPDLTETIVYIKQKIDDADRNQTAKLIQLK